MRASRKTKKERMQVITDSSMDMKEVKTFIPLAENEFVFLYPIGEVM